LASANVISALSATVAPFGFPFAAYQGTGKAVVLIRER
jgi:hypothetical protein